ncbi:MAG: CrcB protein [Halobacteriales archaeon]|jgi:CrcB protein
MPDGRSIAIVESLVPVALGGFAGANARYADGLVLPSLPATLAVDAVGSLALGGRSLRTRVRPGVLRSGSRSGPGTRGTFTTFSTFSFGTFQLLERGKRAKAA